MSAQDFDPEDYTQDAREAVCLILSRTAKKVEELYNEASALGLENAKTDAMSSAHLLVALLQLVMPENFAEASIEQKTRAQEAGL